jgi:hypothetical protein
MLTRRIVDAFLMTLPFSSAAGSLLAAEAGPAPAPAVDPARFHLFLLAGQSNMAGRGDVEASDTEAIEGVLALNAKGEWVPARDPVHWDKPTAGAGLARTFAREYLLAHSGVTVGLIPAACGGSPIATWAPGKYFEGTHSHPYDDAIARARPALARGTLRGILWHQGESDRSVELAPRYEQALTELIARFRSDLKAPNVPVVIGQLGRFLDDGKWGDLTSLVDRAQQNVVKKTPLSAFVSSEGLVAKSDHLHFDSPSLREFGRRYAAALASVKPPR